MSRSLLELSPELLEGILAHLDAFDLFLFSLASSDLLASFYNQKHIANVPHKMGGYSNVKSGDGRAFQADEVAERLVERGYLDLWKHFNGDSSAAKTPEKLLITSINFNTIEFCKHIMKTSKIRATRLDEILLEKRESAKKRGQLIAHDLDRSFPLLNLSTENGYAEIFRWALSLGFHFGEETVAMAVRNHALTIVEILLEKFGEHCPGADKICQVAAEVGSIESIKLTRKYGIPLRKSAATVATKYNRMEILTYLVEEGCELDAWVCHYAAMNGNLEMIKLARERGVPWDERTMYFAIQNGHDAILAYLLEMRCPGFQMALEYASFAGNLEVLKR